MDDNPDLVCGVDRLLVERFLRLVRDNFPKADAANFFLEQITETTVNISGIANQRDILAHLATMLDPKTTPEKREEQIAGAEEHMRRAVFEPYVMALYAMFNNFKLLYDKFRTQVLPLQGRWPELHDVPAQKDIDAEFQRISKGYSAARAASTFALGTSESKHGVAAFVSTYESLQQLKARIEPFVSTYEAVMLSRTSEPRNEDNNAHGHSAVGFARDLPPSHRAYSPPTTLLNIVNLVERLRVGVHARPQKEREIQDVFETLMVGASVRYSREADRVEYSTKTYIPDFTVGELNLAVEVKLCNREGREKEIIGEINDDILAYRCRYTTQLYIIYDNGYIRDASRFTSAFAEYESVMVRIIKH